MTVDEVFYKKLQVKVKFNGRTHCTLWARCSELDYFLKTVPSSKCSSTAGGKLALPESYTSIAMFSQAHNAFESV